MERRIPKRPMWFLTGAVCGWLFITGCGNDSSSASFSIPAADLRISPPYVYNFGLVLEGSSAVALFIVTNRGDIEATDLSGSFTNSMFNYSGDVFPGTNGDCTQTLLAGSDCLVEVEFAPEYPGDFFDVLRVSFFDGVRHRSTTLPTLEGRGIGP